MRFGSKEFIEFAKEQVVSYYNNSSLGKITDDDVFVVWYCKTLQNHKALLSTTVADGMYYEITFNGDMAEAYLDAYKKWENRCIQVNG